MYETNSTNGFTFPPKGTSSDNRRGNRLLLPHRRPRRRPAASPRRKPTAPQARHGGQGPTLSFAGSRGWTLQGLECELYGGGPDGRVRAVYGGRHECRRRPHPRPLLGASARERDAPRRFIVRRRWH
jgi:hypothetical protein